MLASDVIDRAEKRVGQTLKDKWQLDRVIGVGGMAAVYEATHRNKNRVAIKILHPEMSLDEGTRGRFLREGYVANTIRHVGAVQVLDDDVTDDGAAFLVMELLLGESLEERMLRKGGRLEAFEALQLTDGLLEVLIAAHEQHVVHRDIKPDNLFLTQTGQVKVLDFGIARLHESGAQATRVGSFMGTPAFCAPEQARGRWNEVDARTDLFSVGATLFTMLTGRHVHEAETSSEQLALAISSTPRSLRELLPDAPDDLVDLVDQSLAYDKEDRFQTARAMRAAVQRTMAGIPSGKVLSAPPATVMDFSESVHLPRASLSPVGQRLLFLATAAFIGGLGIFAGTYFRGGDSARGEPEAPALTPTKAEVAVAAAAESPPAPPSPSVSDPPKEAPLAAAQGPETVVVRNTPKKTTGTPAPVEASPRTPKPDQTSEDALFGKRY